MAMRNSTRTLLAGICILAFQCSFVLQSSAQFEERRNSEALWNEGEPQTESRSELELSGVAESIVDEVNAFRDAYHAEPLTVDQKLSDAAQEFAEYMARSNRFGHTADDRKPSERIAAHDYQACFVAENIAYRHSEAELNSDELAADFVKVWEQSAGHRKNMLNPHLLETGVGIAQSESGTYFAVQVFARPTSKAIRFTVRNRSNTDVKYELGEEEFDLPGRYTRAHSLCMPMVLKLASPGSSGKGATFAVADGDQFEIREVKDMQFAIERAKK